MNSGKWFQRRTPLLLASLLAGAGLLGAADDVNTPAANPPSANAAAAQSQNDEIAKLKASLAAQQKQLEALQKALTQQQQALDHAATAGSSAPAAPPASLGNVASLTPVIPVAPAAAVAFPSPAPQPAPTTPANPCEADVESGSPPPPYLRLGSTCVAPVGFMDFTSVWRDKNAASGIGTNFASIPYNNGAAGRLSEFRMSLQNSRIGFRIDGDWKGTHFIGYNEFDFLGTSGGNNLGVTNGAFVPRARLYWVDARKGKLEMLAGQSWSLLTPNRKGLSPLPGDIFYSQVMDVNYLIGLTWTRQAGLRLVYHPNDKVAAGIAFENPDQYIGGSAGFSATAVTLPAASALSGIGGTQVDNATNVLNTPNVMPDIIAKIAFDPTSRFHFEVGGLVREFKLWDSATNAYHSSTGAGLLFGGNAGLTKNFRVITSNFYSDGGGRYLFGTAPDFIVRADGSISPVRAMGTVDGFEATVKNSLLFLYYGGAYVGRDVALDANGTSLIGYGYKGSSNADNRTMQEVTMGLIQTFWKSPRYGALSLITQYEYAMRAPWYYAAGQAGGKGTQDTAIYGDIRYTLPGTSPNF